MSSRPASASPSACCLCSPSSAAAPWSRAQHRGRRHHPAGRRRQRHHRIRRLQADQRRGRGRGQAGCRAGDGATPAAETSPPTRCSRTPRLARRLPPRQGSFVSMDGLYLLGFGPRSARAARDLAVALYPDLKPKPLPSERTAAPADACRGNDARSSRRRSERIGVRRRGRRPATVIGLLLLDSARRCRCRSRRSAPPEFRSPACPQRLGLPAGRRRSGDAAPRPAGALVGPAAAHRARGHRRRAARLERRHHAGAVPQSARRSGAGRRFERRRACGGRHHRDRRPARCAGQGRRCRSNFCRFAAFLGVAGRDLRALSRRDARIPDLDRDLPARRACDRGAGQCRHRPAGFHRRRPAIARRDVLAARLAQRRDLGQGRRSSRRFWPPCCSPCR